MIHLVVTRVKVMDDEKPDVEELFEQVSVINSATEFYLEDSALDGLSSEEAENEIAEYMNNQFQRLNPFDNPKTTTTVEFSKVEKCENEKTREVDETGYACKPNESSSGRKVQKTVAKVFNEFQGVDEETVAWTARRTLKLEKNLMEEAVNLLPPVAESCTGAVGEVRSNILSKMKLKEPLSRLTPFSYISITKLFQSILMELPEGVYPERSFKLHRWMAHLSPKMRKVPFTMLAIPGIHNSATHTM